MPINPPLLLSGNSSLIADNAYWTEDDNTGDPFIGFPYKWEVQINVEPQLHSNSTTMTPYAFTGTDVVVGDWYSSVTGIANRISEITVQTPTSLTVILEDYERYNLFADPNQSGSGLAPDGPGFIFRLGNDGLPVLGPMADFFISPTTAINLQARFFARNIYTEFVLVNQEDHGMVPGDIIYADFEANAGYKKTDSANISRAIGIVTEVNVPGLDYFCYRPLGKLVMNVRPTLWGEHGDIFYLDPNEPGGLTNEKPLTNAFPVYLQLEPNRAILLSRGVETSDSGPNVDSETHKYDVENVVSGQTMFTLPMDAREVLYMAINGIENENFTFNEETKVLIFDPIETGYGVDIDDEVFFIYKT